MGKLQQYAELIIRYGVNIQEGKPLVIRSTTDAKDFARALTEAAYDQGASVVTVMWSDERVKRLKFEKGGDEVFTSFPKWEKMFFDEAVEDGASLISISAEDPDLLSGIDPNRISSYSKVRMEGLKNFYDKMMTDQLVWCVVSIPTPAWAKKMFPGKTEDQAMEALWEAIFRAVRVDLEDPVQAWADHDANLERRKKVLNDYHFEKLIYTNSLGTNLEVRLADKHLWNGGSAVSSEGIKFFANMPTEEIFTMPDRNGTNGMLYSALPLSYQGNIIDKFWFKFEEGKIVDFGAEVGEDVLREMIDFDEGARYLGEVALVDDDSPISNMKTLFFNTLYDENASCHFAIGRAYPTTLIGGAEMTPEELKAEGANDSLTHVDFMVGTSDLAIVGVTADGKEVQVFKDGNLVI